MAIKRRKSSSNKVLKEGEYEKSNGTYEFRWRNKVGKRLSIYAPTLEELRDKETDVLKNVLDGLRVDNNKLTVNDLFERWKELKRGLKDNTYRNYIYMYEFFAKETIGTCKIVNLKRTDVRAFYNNLYDGKHLKVRTIECLHTVLHQIIEIAVEDEYIRFNPSDNALRELKKAHNIDEQKRQALTVKEQKIFEQFLKQPGQLNQWHPIFTIMLWTGMRVGEITGLRYCDVNLEEGWISVNHTLVYYDKGGNGISFGINTPKTKKSHRTIPMLPKVKEAFLLEMKHQEEAGIVCKSRVDGYTDFIFVNRFGGVQHQGTLNKALRRIIRDCNFAELDKNQGKEDVVTIPPISNHILRHTFATRMCESGMNIKAISEILGHSEIETTLNIYTSVTKDFKKTVLDDFAKCADSLEL